MFAELPLDPTGGWVPIILQGGALGLLAYLVVWIFPSYQKDIVEERKANMAERERRDQIFSDLVELLQDRADQRSDVIAKEIKAQTISLLTEMKDNAKAYRDALDSVCLVKKP